MNFEDMLCLYNTDHTRGISRVNLDEAALLWSNVKAYRNRSFIKRPTVLEIGTRFGGTTALLLAAECRVITVDLAPEIDPQVADMLSVHEATGRLVSVVGDSKELVLTGPVDIIFIDGDHTYKGVLGDVEQHWPELKTHGLAIFHDARPCKPGHSEGVARVVDELIQEGRVKVVETVRSTVVLEKLN